MRRKNVLLLATGLTVATVMSGVSACSSEKGPKTDASGIEVTPGNAEARALYLERKAKDKLDKELVESKVTKVGGVCVGYVSTVGYNMVLDPYVYTVDTSNELFQYFGLLGTNDGNLANLQTAPGPASYVQKDPTSGQEVTAASLKPPGLMIYEYGDHPKTETVEITPVANKVIPGMWELADGDGDPISYVKTVGPTQPTDFAEQCDAMREEFEAFTK